MVLRSGEINRAILINNNEELDDGLDHLADIQEGHCKRTEILHYSIESVRYKGLSGDRGFGLRMLCFQGHSWNTKGSIFAKNMTLVLKQRAPRETQLGETFKERKHPVSNVIAKEKGILDKVRLGTATLDIVTPDVAIPEIAT